MSKFIGRRYLGGGDGYGGVTDHGLLTGLSDDDHLQYLITSAIRVVSSATSGINKTGATSGDVFSLVNAGSGAALYIRQTGTTSDADGAVDIDNTGNVGRALAIFSSTTDPLLPLVQFSALDASFDEPILLITHQDPRGLALDVRGDGYLSGVLDGPMAITFTGLSENPIELGTAGIYSENDVFYYVDSEGVKHTFSLDEKVKVSSTDTVSEYLGEKLLAGTNITITELNVGGDEALLISSTASGGAADAYIDAGCNIIVDQREDGFYEVSLDIQSIAGEGLVVDPTAGCPRLKVELDAYQISYDDSGNTYIFADNIQDAITEIDGYLAGGRVYHVRKLGSEADDYPFNTVFSLDGYEYPRGEDRLLVYLNGIAQFAPINYTEYSTEAIEISEPCDNKDVIDVLILPGSLGGGFGGTTTLQNTYDNSPSGAKTITVDDGQITFIQTLGTGSALRLISSGSVTPTIIADQGGSGQAARLKSVDPSSATLLIQKDTTTRNTVINTAIIERTTSHINGGQTGIGSGILTRLESSGTNLFSASRLVTGTESAADAIEKTYFAIEVSDDGVLTEHIRLTSDGSLALNTTSPEATLHVQGDGYFSQGVEVAGQIKIHNDPLAPLNLPVLTYIPVTLSHGDVWVSDISGTRKLNVRINGVTYSATLT